MITAETFLFRLGDIGASHGTSSLLDSLRPRDLLYLTAATNQCFRNETPSGSPRSRIPALHIVSLPIYPRPLSGKADLPIKNAPQLPIP